MPRHALHRYTIRSLRLVLRKRMAWSRPAWQCGHFNPSGWKCLVSQALHASRSMSSTIGKSMPLFYRITCSGHEPHSFSWTVYLVYRFCPSFGVHYNPNWICLGHLTGNKRWKMRVNLIISRTERWVKFNTEMHRTIQSPRLLDLPSRPIIPCFR